MIVDMPATNTQEVSKKLVRLAEQHGGSSVGRVLTLVVCTEEGDPTEGAIDAANDASQEHPCRVIVIARGSADVPTQLDAQLRIGGDAGASEVVVLRLYGELVRHAASVVTPFLLPDTPVVTWWPGEAPAVPSRDPLGQLGIRRITDASKSADPTELLHQRLSGYTEGDTDLAWAQITRWRALLTSALDSEPHEQVTSALVRGPKGAGIDLLAGWLRARLDVSVTRATGGFEIRLSRPSGDLVLALDEQGTAVLSIPGHPDGKVAISTRSSRDCIAEELRRLDPDPIYHQALQGCTEVSRQESA